jgi:hypothetical protein
MLLSSASGPCLRGRLSSNVRPQSEALLLLARFGPAAPAHAPPALRTRHEPAFAGSWLRLCAPPATSPRPSAASAQAPLPPSALKPSAPSRSTPPSRRPLRLSSAVVAGTEDTNSTWARKAGAGRPSAGGRRTSRCPRTSQDRLVGSPFAHRLPAKTKTPILARPNVAGLASPRQFNGWRVCSVLTSSAQAPKRLRPNPSLEPTRSGKAPWPPRAQYHVAPVGQGALPPWSAQLKR